MTDAFSVLSMNILTYLFPLRERLGIDDIILILQQNRLQWYGHLLLEEDTDWVKKCMEYEVGAPDQEVDQRGRGERLSKKIAKHVI